MYSSLERGVGSNPTGINIVFLLQLSTMVSNLFLFGTPLHHQNSQILIWVCMFLAVSWNCLLPYSRYKYAHNTFGFVFVTCPIVFIIKTWLYIYTIINNSTKTHHQLITGLLCKSNTLRTLSGNPVILILDCTVITNANPSHTTTRSPSWTLISCYITRFPSIQYVRISPLPPRQSRLWKKQGSVTNIHHISIFSPAPSITSWTGLKPSRSRSRVRCPQQHLIRQKLSQVSRAVAFSSSSLHTCLTGEGKPGHVWHRGT